ncbi:MAG: N-formylglutamate amidohydrolase [Alphaproteobacteria bacterium]|nr:N-formylglutamate amidohydrolase [Alphaproteobacteria bacterium]MBL6940183.1 N-formylglutamate amidohydrolase [Alphaproteobacteria bacterium]MBL7100270.1 N-formylglutamate amidohydrolase [Alphaproteobacteria bacterium]
MAQHGKGQSDGSGGEDLSLAALYVEPFRIFRPFRQTVPFVFASPHSGRAYPQSFVAASRLNAVSLRRSEDAFVDELFCGAVAMGAPMIAARFPRAFLDVNRSPAEIDTAMFDGALDIVVDAPSPRVTAGLGVIPRIVRDGADIYRTKLKPGDAEERLSRLHRPYHAALARLIDETRALFGVAVVIDCHSMPSAAAIPDVVFGDRYGMAAAPTVTRAAELAFEAQGFSHARNAPYAGGYTTHTHGRRDRDTHALQVEINRALYLDEERIARGPQFEQVHARLNEAIARLVTIEPAALIRTRRHSLAAE